jgi:hypothetical protein
MALSFLTFLSFKVISPIHSHNSHGKPPCKHNVSILHQARIVYKIHRAFFKIRAPHPLLIYTDLFRYCSAEFLIPSRSKQPVNKFTILL